MCYLTNILHGAMLLQEFNARLSHGYFKSVKNQRDAIQWHFEKFDVVKRNVKLFDRLRKDGNRTERLQQMSFVNESGFYAFWTVIYWGVKNIMML